MTAPEDAVDEARRVGAAQLLGGLDGLVDRDLGGHVVAVEQLVERHAQDVPLERRDPVERPALGVALDQRVELLALALDALDQLAREVGARRGSSSSRSGRPVTSAGRARRPRPGAGRSGACHARETYSPERVSTRTRSPTLTNSGTRTVTPDSSVAGLSPPPEAVSPCTPGSVSVTAISTALGTWTSDGLLVHVEQLDLLVLA